MISLSKHFLEQKWVVVKPILRKILAEIKNSKEKQTSYYDAAHDRRAETNDKFDKVTIQGLANANGNYLFNNHQYEFGVTEEEAHLIREHFQNYHNNPKPEDYEIEHFTEMQKVIDEYFPPAVAA